MTRPRILPPPPCLQDVIRATESRYRVTLAKEVNHA